MLKRLKINNLALLESAELEFENGLTVLTGETGAGKSIIVNALSLALGGRGDREHIRHKADFASVEAIFDVSSFPAEYKNSFSEFIVNDNIRIYRELKRSGKAKVQISGIASTLNELKEVTGPLAEILGQHANQMLMNENNHLDFLDNFASLGELKQTVKDKFILWREQSDRLFKLRNKRDTVLKERELLIFQKDEIEKAKLSPGEEEQISHEKKILDSVRSLMASANLIKDIFENDKGSISQSLNIALKELDKIVEVDPSLTKVSEEMKDLIFRLDDINSSIESYGSSLNDDPARIEQINLRLDEIYNLKKKYGGSEEAVVKSLTEINKQLDDSPPDIDAYIDKLENECVELFEDYSNDALSLTDTRKKASAYLQKMVVKEFKELAINSGGFKIEFIYQEDPSGVIINGRAVKPGANGLETARILFSANPGEPLKSLVKTASGGEISRVLLALKSAEKKNNKRSYALMVFDEVDAGIGGQTAVEVARKLKKLSDNSQLLVITHLHQIAREADFHLVAEKNAKAKSNRSVIKVNKLDSAGKNKELARMLALPKS